MSAMRASLLMLGLVGVACATGRPLGAGWPMDEAYRPFAAAPATVEIPPSVVPDTTSLALAPGARAEVLEAARSLLGRRSVVIDKKRFPDDCTGLIRAAFSRLGVDLMSSGEPQDNGVTAIWRFTANHGRLYDGGRPIPGDLVFFRETYDLNRDGLVNDGLTHIGLVDDVEIDGTVVVLHRVSRGVVRYRMNLAAPSTPKDASGKTINDGLRLAGAGSEHRLTGELFVSYGTLLPVEPVATWETPPTAPNPPGASSR
jgi:hypothetical protein